MDTNQKAVSRPYISVVIPTRHRPDDVRRCLDSLTHVVYPNWDILLVDQSDDRHTHTAIDDYTCILRRLNYLHVDEQGASRARNVGITASTGEIIAFLDDDCTVEPDWLEKVAATFMRYPKAAMICGSLRDAIQDKRYYVLSIELKRERILRGRFSFRRAEGVSANMYVRRIAQRRVGFFDVFLGPGGYFPCGGDDRDYIYRYLAAGYSVVETPSIVAHHYGAREYANGAVARLFRGYLLSEGALLMKALRCGDIAAAPLIVERLRFHLSYVYWRNVLLLRHPFNIMGTAMLLRGLAESFQLDVDRRQRLYRTATHRSASPIST